VVRRLVRFFILGVLATAAVCVGQARGGHKRVMEVLKRPGYSKARFSVHFCDSVSGKTIFEHNRDNALVPASNMKVITTAAAIAILGSDFVYETTVGLLGDDLVVFGSGNPLTGDPVTDADDNNGIYGIFERVRSELQKRGKVVIEGNLLIDDTIFDDNRFHTSWPAKDADKWWTAQVSGLNFNNNCLDVTFRPGGAAGAPAKYEVIPDTEYVTITNKCVTIAVGKTRVGAVRIADTNKITFRGKCKRAITKPIHVALNRPSAFFGCVMDEYLASRGVRIKGGHLIIKRLRDEMGRLPVGLDVLVVHRTALAEVLQRCNEHSLNLAAECLMKTLGTYSGLKEGQSCQQGSWANGRAAIERYLEKLGIGNRQYVIDDGSGLSKKNRLSGQCLTTVLLAVAQSKDAQIFRAALSTPTTGTLAKSKRFAEARYRQRLFAKTGYVNGAWALSGYCQHNNGRWLTFAVIINSTSGKSMRAVVDEIVKAMMD